MPCLLFSGKTPLKPAIPVPFDSFIAVDLMKGAFRLTPHGAMEPFTLTSVAVVPQRLTVGGLVQLEQWQHFVFQRDADGNMEIWVDGEEVASQGGAEPLDEFNGIITIGAEGPTQANSLAGRIDDFAIFNN